MAREKAPEHEENRRLALRNSPIANRANAWARCDALRKKGLRNLAYQRLVDIVASLHPDKTVIRDQGDRRIEGIVLELPIGKYNADIALPWLGLVIEHDEGTSNHEPERAKKADGFRDEAMKQLGWNVLRIRHLELVFVEEPKAIIKAKIETFSRTPCYAGIPEPLVPHPCECGCGTMVKARSRYVHGHHLTKELAAKAGASKRKHK